MRTPGIVAIIGLASAVSAAPVTREQLLRMAREKVDPGVMRAIVERDCVDFDVDAGNVAGLSKAVPAAVLEAAIACRRAAHPAPAAAPPAVPLAAAAPVTPEEPAPPVASPPVPPPPPGSGNAPPLPAPPAAPAPARIRLRAVFIGESGALRCTASIDGAESASFLKEEQGKFGEAVERSRIGRETPYLPVAPGRRRVLFRCDPNDQQVPVDVDVAAGESRTVEIAETTFRRWKLRRVITP